MKRSLLASLALLSALALPTRAQDVPVVVVPGPTTTPFSASIVIDLAEVEVLPILPTYGTETIAVRGQPGHPLEFRLKPGLYANAADFVWYKNGQRLAASGATLSLASPTVDDSGTYHVTFTLNGISHTAGPVPVLVGNTSALVTRAISLRAFIDPAKPAAVVGFVISAQAGSSASNLKPVLVRVIGPSLSRFGVAQPLATPRVTLYRADGTEVPETSSVPSARLAAALTGAFPLEDGTADVAFVRNLPAGTYTAQVSSTSSAAGEVLIEIWSMDPNVAAIGRTLSDIQSDTPTNEPDIQ